MRKKILASILGATFVIGALVGCGSNVLKTVEQERCVIVGNPARVLDGKDSMDSL